MEGIKNNKKFNMLKIMIASLTLVVLFAFLSFGEKITREQDYSAYNGVLNLENVNWTELESVPLNGEWQFYANKLSSEITITDSSQLKSVPHFWENDSQMGLSPYGYGTYKLQVTGLAPSGIYGLEILDEVSAYNLWVNDVLVASNGLVGNNVHDFFPQWKPEVGVFQADAEGNAAFIMEISNFSYYRGGFWNRIMIGNVDHIISQFNGHKLFDMFLFASIIIIGISNFVMFLLYRWQYSAMFYFSLFCFTMGVRTSLVGYRIVNDMVSNPNWYLLIRLEYLFGYLLMPLFALFVISFFKSSKHKVVLKRIFVGITIFFTVVTIFLPNAVYVLFLEPYKWLSILVSLYLVFLTSKSAKRNSLRARVMVLIVLGFIVAIFKEVYVGGTMSWLPFATLNLIVCFSFLTFNQLMKSVHEKEVLETKALHDHLTGLYNRNYINKLETENYFLGNRKAVMFLDLDSFKFVNDTYGHDAGDYILRACSHRIKNLLRNTDILCRYGGDEFIIIIDNVDNNIDHIKMIAERIIKTIQEPIINGDNSFNISASIGISIMENDTKSIDAFIRQADEAMYAAKRNGGSRFVLWQT